MFIHPQQVTQLRKDANFLSADKYQAGVMLRGEIGLIANCPIVPTRRIKYVSGAFVNPIIQLNSDPSTSDNLAALKLIYKRNVLLETQRKPGVLTSLTATTHYTSALTNDSRVVLINLTAPTDFDPTKKPTDSEAEEEEEVAKKNIPSV